MSRYRGPIERIERYLNTDLSLKGERRLSGKVALQRRPYPPGQHGQKSSKTSEYGLQLKEKQKAKYMYGVSERQFLNLFREASMKPGNTGENLVLFLESRLDNVVFRLGFATNRRFARQLVTHGHVLIDNKRVDIPSYRVKPGQTIKIKEKLKNNIQVKRSLDLSTQSGLVDWLDVDKDNVVGVFKRIPQRDEISIPIEERIIVELYSK